MKISDDLALFLKQPVIFHLGTCSEQNIPLSTRAIGSYLCDDGQKIVVFILQERSERALHNLVRTGHAALLCIEPLTYRSIQIKGAFIETRELTESEKNIQQAYLTQLEHARLPEKYYKMKHEPALAILINIEHVYNQSPGPGAGELIRDQ